MSKLGLAAIAANSYFDQNRVMKDREHQDAQRAYDQANMDASLSTLPDRTQATAARAGLDTATSNASAAVLPGQTDLALLGQQKAMGDTQQAIKTQPTIHAQQEKALGLAGQKLDMEIEQMPARAQEAYLKGKLSREQMANDIVGTLGLALKNEDKGTALRFANAVAKQDGLYPGTDGKNFVDVRPVGAKTAAGDTRAYELVASDGSKVSVPFKSIESAVSSMSDGKYGVVKTEDGGLATFNQKTGEVKVPVKGELGAAKLAQAQGKLPSVIQITEYLQKNGIAKSHQEAFTMAKTLGQKPRTDAIREMANGIVTASFGGVDLAQAIKQATEVYDNGFGNGAGPSNSRPASKIDPQVDQLFPPPN